MEPTKKQQLDELRAMRSQVIGELRHQHNRLKAARRDRSSDPLRRVEDILHALISLQETEHLLEQWKESEAQNEKQ
jgi:hypothetical protein